jgi:hypothetical protein
MTPWSGSHRRRRRFGAAATLCSLLGGGCSADQRAADVSVTDSAGVRIVSSDLPEWREGEEWRLGAEPVLAIGEPAASPEEEFNGIRRVLSLRDGSIVVASMRQPPALRIYDASGAYVRTIGREGAGPGEFRAVWDVWFAGSDTLVVFDPGVSRVSYFGTDGSLLGSVNLLQPEGRTAGLGAVPWARFSDGTFLMRPNRFLPDSADGPGRSSVHAVRVRDDGSVVDTVGFFPEADFVISPSGGPRQPRFGKLAVIYVHGTSIYRGMGDDFTIDEWDVTGRKVRSIRRRHEPRPVTQPLVDALRAHDVEAAPPARQDAIRRDYDERPRVDVLPAFGNTWLLDADGNLWVQDFLTAVDTASRWTVFAADGRWLGEVPIPIAFRPHEIGTDYVLGVWRDELDVETVRRYPLTKPGS